MNTRAAPSHSHRDPITVANALLANLPGRRTRGRAHVLAALIETRRAMTHTEIEVTLPPDVVLDRVTLYRILDWLVEHNMIHRVAGADRAVRFAFSGSTENVAHHMHTHAHFQCDSCGRVVCLDALPAMTPQLEGGYLPRKVDVLVHGLCNICHKGQPVVRHTATDHDDIER